MSLGVWHDVVVLMTTSHPEGGVQILPSPNFFWEVTATTGSSQSFFINDASKIWNKAPNKIKNCITLNSAKKEFYYCYYFGALVYYSAGHMATALVYDSAGHMCKHR